jgi:tetratricopeptide (TPR) repeat protein
MSYLYRTISAIAIVAAALLLPHAAHASGRDAYYKALETEKAGDMKGAMAALREVAAAGQEFSDDSLMEIGRLCEEELLDGECAIEAYRELVSRFPASRLLRRANAKVEVLSAVQHQYLKTTLEFRKAILQLHASRDASIDAVKKIVSDNPGFPGVPHALFWLGETERGSGNEKSAIGFYEELTKKHPASPWSYKALRSLGDIAFRNKDYRLAAEYYGRASMTTDRTLSAAALLDLKRAGEHLERQRFSVLALVILFSFWLVLAVLLKKEKVRPGVFFNPVPEALFLATAMLILVALTAYFQRPHTVAIAAISAVFIVTSQLSGVFLRQRLVSGSWKVAYAAAALLATFCGLYAVIVRGNLFGAIQHTITFGPG